MMFVLRSLVAAALVVMLLQVEVGGVKLEVRAENWLISSPVSVQLRQVAAGALKMTHDLSQQAVKWAGLQAKPSASTREWGVEFRHRRAKDETRQQD